MSTYSVKIKIKASLKVVFNTISNWENMLEMERGLQKIEYLTEPTQRMGMRGIWHFKQGDKTWRSFEEIVGYNPPTYVAWTTYQEDGKTLWGKGSHNLTSIDNNTATELVMTETFYADHTKEWALGMMQHLLEHLKMLSEKASKTVNV